MCGSMCHHFDLPLRVCIEPSVSLTSTDVHRSMYLRMDQSCRSQRISRAKDPEDQEDEAMEAMLQPEEDEDPQVAKAKLAASEEMGRIRVFRHVNDLREAMKSNFISSQRVGFIIDAQTSRHKVSIGPLDQVLASFFLALAVCSAVYGSIFWSHVSQICLVYLGSLGCMQRVFKIIRMADFGRNMCSDGLNSQ